MDSAYSFGGDEDQEYNAPANTLTRGIPRDPVEEMQRAADQARQAAIAQGATQSVAPAAPAVANPDDAYRWPKFTPQPIPPAPSAYLPEHRQLEQNLALYGKPIDRNAPDIKPKMWQRIGGGVSAALMAFGHVPGAAEIGSGVVNRNYDRAEAARQTNLKGAQISQDALNARQLAENRNYEQTLQGNTQNLAQFNSAERASQGQALADNRRATEQQRLQGIAPGSEMPDDPKNPMGTWHATSIEGKPITMSQPPDKWLATPQAKQIIEKARRQGVINDLHLTGEDAKYMSADGNLRQPNPTTNIRMPSEGNREFDVYLKSLGHPPTTQDILNFKRGSGAGGRGNNTPSGMPKAIADRIQSQKDTAFNKARQTYNASDKTPADFDDYVNNMQAGQDDFEQRIATQTGKDDIPHTDVRSNVDANGNWKQGAGNAATPQVQQQAQPPTPQPQQVQRPQAQQRAAASQPAQPQPSRGNNLPAGKGQKIDKASGRLFMQAAGGDPVKARQLAQGKGWKF